MRFAALMMSLSLTVACSPEPSSAHAKAKAPAEPAKAEAPVANCTYTVSDAKPGWTAYKFTEKAPVAGTFTTFKMSEAASAASLTDALKGITMEIDGASIESGNPARNITVSSQYFGKFAPTPQIKAAVVSATGDDQKGTVVINIGMNGVSKDVEFAYTVSGEGALQAKATMEMKDFSLQGAFDSIHAACQGLHTGKDGVSKTWTDVALLVDASVKKACK